MSLHVLQDHILVHVVTGRAGLRTWSWTYKWLLARTFRCVIPISVTRLVGTMGQCGGREYRSREDSKTLSKHHDGFRKVIAERIARPPSPELDRGVKSTGRLIPKSPVDFGREEVRLKELFAALRTGLVCTATDFSVLPGISTTAKVVFSVGSNALRDQELELESNEPAAVEENDDDSQSEDEEDAEEEEVYELRVSLYGAPWTQRLRMQLSIRPVVGPFAGRKLLFTWSENLLQVEGCEKGELNARALPVSFENESDFCKCCLLLAYHGDTTGNLHFEEQDTKTATTSNGQMPALSALAYHVTISNLDAIPETFTIPRKISHLLYGSQKPVTMSIRMWPSTFASQFSASLVMKVKSGLVFSEFVFLLREHFHLPSTHTVKLYHNYKPVQLSETVTSKYTTIDCFVITYDGDSLNNSYSSGMDETESDPRAALVVSLVGYGVQNMETNLEMRLRDFDAMLRKRFHLGSDSFLIILAEDDFAPQYTTCDNWKCIYPFSLPDNSLSAGLRRSIRRMSTRRQRDSPISPRQPTRQRSREGQMFTPQMEKVVEILSSGARHFPSNAGKFGASIEDLYESMPMYQMNLERCGIHPYAIIQVFEVTGPSIPITFRVLTDYSHTPSQSKPQDIPRTRLANIMDINPKWSIHTFLQYVDAVISPAAGVRRKRVSLKDHFIEDTEDLSTLTLGELLDLWKPAWWPMRGTKRRQLVIKDIDPSEFLLVEKY